MSDIGPVQRLRITFGRGEQLKYISHLDLMRLWERILRRGDIPLAYSDGYSPHPRISLAAPLPVGVTSEAELMDIFLLKRLSPFYMMKQLDKQLPAGLNVLKIVETPLALPSLQSLVRFAEYRVEVVANRELANIRESLDLLLAAEHFPWERLRDGELRKYDLRKLIDSLWLVDCGEIVCTFRMRLRCDNNGTGRVEDVVSALGFGVRARSVHRTQLILDEPQPARQLQLSKRG